MHSLLLPGAISNHWTLLLCLLGICAVFPTPQPLKKNSPVFPALRTICFLTYAFAFLHKLNRGYLDLHQSAVRDFFHQVLQNLPAFDEERLWTNHGMELIVLSLLIEGSLPILLFIRPLRRFACLLGLLFHGSIVLCQHGDYSQVILSCYPLFFSEPECADRWKSLRRVSRLRALASGAAVLLLVRISYLHPLWMAPPPGLAARIALGAEGLLVFALLLATCLLALSFLLDRPGGAPMREGPEGPKSRGWQLATWLLAASYSFSCLGPYLGLQFYHAQAMFSSIDLRTGNHLFLPRVPLFHNDAYVHDLRVQWGSAPDPSLVAGHPGLEVLLAHRGQVSMNYLRAILAHACETPSLRPLSISYSDEAGRSEAVDPCATGERRRGYSRATPYPWFLAP